jgi:alpha-beta hydrolase superfamily lysophospholipase
MSYTGEYAFEVGRQANARGQLLQWLSSRRLDCEPAAVALLPSGYERQIYHYSVFARTLADNGFATVRFDLSNHIGLSDGEVADLTMSGIADDVRAMLRAPAVIEPGLPVLVLAPSLAARAAARALADGDRVAGCIGFLPVADAERTIVAVSPEADAQRWRSGEITDSEQLGRVSEHDVKAAFLQDLVENDWGGVEQARKDISGIEAPMLAIAAEQDEWVRVEDVQVAMSGPADFDRSVIVLEATSHEVMYNPPVMRLMMEKSVAAAAGMTEVQLEEISIPGFRHVAETVTAERRWARAAYAEIPCAPEEL